MSPHRINHMVSLSNLLFRDFIMSVMIICSPWTVHELFLKMTPLFLYIIWRHQYIAVVKRDTLTRTTSETCWWQSGPPRKKLQGGTRLLWSLWDKLIVLSNWKYKKTKQKTKKRLWVRLWDPSEIHITLLGSPDSGPMYRLNPSPLS